MAIHQLVELEIKDGTCYPLGKKEEVKSAPFASGTFEIRRGQNPFVHFLGNFERYITPETTPPGTSVAGVQFSERNDRSGTQEYEFNIYRLG